MSRVKSLHIPFSNGATDEINAKLLPNGVFASVSNGRIPQQGGLRLRRGWRPLVMKDLVNNTTLKAIDLYSYQDSLVALTQRVSSNALCLATFTQSNAARPWVLNTDSALPPATRLRTRGNLPSLQNAIVRGSAAITFDGVYGCVLQQSATETAFRVFVMATDEVVSQGTLPNGARLRKVVSMQSKFGLVENTTTGLDLYSFDPVATNPTWTLLATMFSATVTWFDVAVAADSTPIVLHVADVVAGAAHYRQFTFAGNVQVGTTQTIAASGTEAVTLWSDDVSVRYVYQDSSTHKLSLVSFSASAPFTTIAGPTAVDAARASTTGVFAVTARASSTVIVAAEHSTDEFSTSTYQFDATTHAAGAVNHHSGAHLTGGWLARSFSVAMGVTRAGTGMYQPPSSECAWFLAVQGAAQLLPSGSRIPFWPGQCPTGDALVLTPLETSPISVRTQAVTVLSTERRPAVELADGLYITGGQLVQWVGGLAENGMLAPIVDFLQDNGSGGSIAAGAYSYIAVLVWTDEKRRVHRSLVSTALGLSVASGSSSVTATVFAPKTLRRNTNLISNPHIELFRTEEGPGSLFYRVAVANTADFADSVDITDTLADASIISAPQLYTQGEFGATSGILEQAPAESCAFVAATKRRLICGSADTSYQFSQVTLPEIPAFFADPGESGDPAQAYFDDVDGGAITGVATLDEVVYVGTSQRIYVTGGAGPNLAGVGEFSPPAQLPADVGFFNALSILETSEGLWFLGSANTMYLLARGTPTPVLNRAVQDHLTDPVVGCGYDHEDNIAAWAMAGASPKLIIRQLDTKQWFVEPLPFTPIALHSHLGHLYAIDSSNAVWAYGPGDVFGDGASGATGVALQVATGAVEPFGIAGWGRLASLELLGEYQADATILGEISYDDGATWTSLGTHAITGLSAGATFQRQWFPARQRGGRFRVRVTMTPTVSTTEGCRLPGLTVSYVLKSGQTRLPAASRR